MAFACAGDRSAKFETEEGRLPLGDSQSGLDVTVRQEASSPSSGATSCGPPTLWMARRAARRWKYVMAQAVIMEDVMATVAKVASLCCGLELLSTMRSIDTMI
jgi:hypothetical protein